MQEAKIERSVRTAFTAVVLMSFGSLVEISSLLSNTIGLLALLFFIRAFILDRHLNRRVCSTSKHIPTQE